MKVIFKEGETVRFSTKRRKAVITKLLPDGKADISVLRPYPDYPYKVQNVNLDTLEKIHPYEQ